MVNTTPTDSAGLILRTPAPLHLIFALTYSLLIYDIALHSMSYKENVIKIVLNAKTFPIKWQLDEKY